MINEERTLYLIGEIDEVNAGFIRAEIRRLKKQGNDDIHLMIDSLGGNVYEAYWLIECMWSSKCKVKTYARRHAASAALMVLSAGECRYRMVGEECYLLNHPIQYHPIEGLGPIRKFLLWIIEKIRDALYEYIEMKIRKNCRMSKSEWKRLRSFENRMSSEEAIMHGYADGIQKDEKSEIVFVPLPARRFIILSE